MLTNLTMHHVRTDNQRTKCLLTPITQDIILHTNEHDKITYTVINYRYTNAMHSYTRYVGLSKAISFYHFVTSDMTWRLCLTRHLSVCLAVC